jgi:hypothetical protein
MKRALWLILAGITGSAAQASDQGSSELAVRTSARSLDTFGRCFVASQERASHPWWFVPADDGGTFSNLGSVDGQRVYFLRVRQSEAGLGIRLETDDQTTSADPVLRSVDSCI